MCNVDVAPQHLIAINSKVETLRLGYGTLIRLCLHSTVYYGTTGFIKEKILGKKDALDISERDAIRYMVSMGAEIGVSLLWMPLRYLAAVNTPRFLLDYFFTSWSDLLSTIDRFHPGRFASYALFTFASDPTAEWSWDFFVWQIPSVLLTVSKLLARRRRVGTDLTRTWRIVCALFAQVLLRAYCSSFSIILPETGSEALQAILFTLLEGMTTSYLVYSTWFFPLEVPKELSIATGSGSNANSGDADGPEK